NRWTWMKIVSKLKLGPEIFYVQIDEPVTGGYYGRIYKYYQQPKDRWRKIKLTDEEIVHCVNLHFISGYYGYKPIEVIKMRDSGKNFVVINNEIKVKKEHGEKKVTHKKTIRYEKGKHR
ncbi:MAG TPA: hypothetical protein PLF61_07655, partial [Candidatus Goldiibacteriota bacterium]|nr:hypothetical protein [Candidatus Goldiibacteriota bacterium]